MTSLSGSRFPERPAPTYTLSEGAIGRERASNPKAVLPGRISCALFILAWAAWLVLTAWVGALR